MSDQKIEQTLMRMMETSARLTHGRGITDSTLASWTLNMTRLLDVCEQIELFCDISVEFSEQHIDNRDSRILRDNDVEKLDHWFASHDPFLERSELIFIETSIVANNNINYHRTMEIGKNMISK